MNVNSLPGKPDMVFRARRAVIFANGCFWHRHNCHLFKWPRTRISFWETKLNANAVRDERNINTLMAEEWRVAVVWECALKGKYRQDFEAVIAQCAEWINSDRQFLEVRGSE